MHQTTLDEPQTEAGQITALEQRGWRVLGTRQEESTLIYSLWRNGHTRDVDDLGAFIRAGARDMEMAGELAVLDCVRKGLTSAKEIRAALSRDYDCSGLISLLRSMVAERWLDYASGAYEERIEL